MADDRLILSKTFEGTFQHFLALVARIRTRNPTGWQANSGECLTINHFNSAETYGSFIVRDKGKRDKFYGAGIIVTEATPGRIKVDFYDGYFPSAPPLVDAPIGIAFKEFAEMIVQELPPPSPSRRYTPFGERLKPPPQTASNDVWLAWYHEQLEQGYKITLEELAIAMGRSPGYVRQLHANYMREHPTDN